MSETDISGQLLKTWIRLYELERRVESLPTRKGCRGTEEADEASEKPVGVGHPNGLPAQSSR